MTRFYLDKNLNALQEGDDWFVILKSFLLQLSERKGKFLIVGVWYRLPTYRKFFQSRGLNIRSLTFFYRILTSIVDIHILLLIILTNFFPLAEKFVPKNEIEATIIDFVHLYNSACEMKNEHVKFIQFT